jgi:hydrogenase nickel incorporation protein HypA/HybF
MHEYSLVMSLVQRVEEEARARRAVAVHLVKVSVGELSGVEPELFRAAYETFREGTICERAALEVATWPASYSCPGCGRVFARGEVLRCPTCDRPAQADARGEALLLDAIEMEVP